MKYKNKQCKDMFLEVRSEMGEGWVARGWMGTLSMGGPKMLFLGLGALKQVCQICDRVPSHTLRICTFFCN